MGLGLVVFSPHFFSFCLSKCKSLSSLAEGSGLDPSQIFRSIAFPLLHPSAGLGLWLMYQQWQRALLAVAATAGFVWIALQGVWEVIKDLREENLSQGADNPWEGSGLGPALPPFSKLLLVSQAGARPGHGAPGSPGMYSLAEGFLQGRVFKKSIFLEEAIVFFMYLDVVFVLNSLTNPELLLFTLVKCWPCTLWELYPKIVCCFGKAWPLMLRLGEETAQNLRSWWVLAVAGKNWMKPKNVTTLPLACFV